MNNGVEIICSDVFEGLKALGPGSVDCCVTSPPYWSKFDYGFEGQLGMEATPALYVERMLYVFREVWRCLNPNGAMWLNLGDTYYTAKGSCFNAGGGPKSRSQKYYDRLKGEGMLPVGRKTPNRMLSRMEAREYGLKPKDLVGIPWRVVLALQGDGWILRKEVIWWKANCRRESVKDRPSQSFEHLFLLAKGTKYWFDKQALPSDNGDVWLISNTPGPPNHPCTFPLELASRCVGSACPHGGLVLDPFAGTGTVGVVAATHGRRAVLIDGKREYCEYAREWIRGVQPATLV